MPPLVPAGGGCGVAYDFTVNMEKMVFILSRKIRELHAPSLVFCSHKAFSSVACNRRYGTSSEHAL